MYFWCAPVLLIVSFQSSAAQLRTEHMITGTQLVNDQFKVGSDITITCSLKHLGGPSTLPKAAPGEPAFDSAYNAISRISLYRTLHNGGSFDNLASFSVNAGGDVPGLFQVVNYKTNGWTYSFGQFKTVILRDLQDTANTMSLTLNIAKANIKDQADYGCELVYVNVNDRKSVAVYHQNITAKANCPPNWLEFRESCYAIFSHPETWLDAQSFCRGAGGFLAEIDDSEENSFLQNMTRGSHHQVWIGGEDRLKEGAWVWSMTQEPLSFKAWGPGEPNDLASSHDIDSDHEDCMVFRENGLWNDYNCYATKQYYACERMMGSQLIG